MFIRVLTTVHRDASSWIYELSQLYQEYQPENSVSDWEQTIYNYFTQAADYKLEEKPHMEFYVKPYIEWDPFYNP